MIKKLLLPTSLARRFSLLMVLFSTLGVFLVALLSYYEHVFEARSQAKSIAVDRTLTIVDAMETAASRESISRFIFSVAAQPSVEAIALVDAADRVILASRRSLRNTDVSELRGVIDEQWLEKTAAQDISTYWDEHNIQAVVIAPIELVNPASSVIRDLQGGRLLFALDAEPHISSARYEAWFDAFWASSILVVMMLLVSWALQRHVTRPLERLYAQAQGPDNTCTISQYTTVGKVRELQALARAISDLADARFALGAEKQRLVDIADSIPGAVYEYRHHPDEKDEFLYFSEGINKQLGLNEELANLSSPADIGTRLFSLIEPEDHDVLAKETQAANFPVPNEWKAEFRVRSNGAIRWIWGHAIPIIDDQPGQLFRGVMLDITDRKELEKRLKLAATRDPLTGALNRAGIEPYLEASLAGFHRSNHPMSLMLLDIDYFKSINDTFGHDIGDSVLSQLVSILRQLLRKTDRLARWGGEEFLVLLPDTDRDGAMMIAEKLRQIVERATFEHRETLTVSLGVTTVKPDDTIRTIVRRADNSLYQAKNEGRNRVKSES